MSGEHCPVCLCDGGGHWNGCAFWENTKQHFFVGPTVAPIVTWHGIEHEAQA
jgi:hypothetical protein